ncbi:uncharacterized protein L969DRAFT_102791 [Mixia osmundae IAM 14324]|uniref:Uncharacterized protein n=1 Tax=Mixia osmundae (strain CBS 9802 / IAM 14324 / JCM 22182 / KY 12970) TaxID=764103 RepID=G7E9W1_MIXOS|nr:uncharacterized protein L969DRAFT_102791 [Mixia osmundae IAM 14324]KEI40064.1 hypothetical protein L969DRAFT_102791 [Mixia osmundae IAM 14324]GAA99430.1 hypothetical protein E5Q_06129 [Mixia osmundae IAM 14324]
MSAIISAIPLLPQDPGSAAPAAMRALVSETPQMLDQLYKLTCNSSASLVGYQLYTRTPDEPARADLPLDAAQNGTQTSKNDGIDAMLPYGLYESEAGTSHVQFVKSYELDLTDSRLYLVNQCCHVYVLWDAVFLTAQHYWLDRGSNAHYICSSNLEGCEEDKFEKLGLPSMQSVVSVQCTD